MPVSTTSPQAPAEVLQVSAGESEPFVGLRSSRAAPVGVHGAMKCPLCLVSVLLLVGVCSVGRKVHFLVDLQPLPTPPVRDVGTVDGSADSFADISYGNVVLDRRFLGGRRKQAREVAPAVVGGGLRCIHRESRQLVDGIFQLPLNGGDPESLVAGGIRYPPRIHAQDILKFFLGDIVDGDLGLVCDLLPEALALPKRLPAHHRIHA